jgi:hypothetical protein
MNVEAVQVKYDLSDWDARKAALLPVLDAAAGDGLVARDQIGRLAEFLLGRGVGVGPVAVASAVPSGSVGLDTPIAAEPVSTVEESEAPRFIRGFHDILITIGVIIGLLGLGGLASVYAVIPAVVVLAEILVRRQRLALPAVVLTIALAIAVGIGVFPILDGVDGHPASDPSPVIFLAVVAAVSLGFYWRYAVPIALASGLVCGLAGVVYGAALMAQWLAGDNDLFGKHPLLFAAFLGAFAVAVFLTALSFDIRDRLRVTRRSDVAFWMHLCAAPALLYTIMAVVYLDGEGGWLSQSTGLYQAAAVVVAVLVLMLIGIVLDRRAFVTSGLLSFGYAFKVLLMEGGIQRLFSSADTLAFVILLAVGVLVLSLGIGWQPLRRRIVGALPAAMQERVPPVRA